MEQGSDQPPVPTGDAETERSTEGNELVSRPAESSGVRPSGPEPEDVETGPAAEDVETDARPGGEDVRLMGVNITQYAHSGPLPDQSWFQAVEQLHSGATELMLNDYRVQREHERDMEVRSFELDRESFRAFARYQTLQLVAVALIAVLIASGGIVLVAAGKSVAGLAVLVGEIAALVL